MTNEIETPALPENPFAGLLLRECRKSIRVGDNDTVLSISDRFTDEERADAEIALNAVKAAGCEVNVVPPDAFEHYRGYLVRVRNVSQVPGVALTAS